MSVRAAAAKATRERIVDVAQTHFTERYFDEVTLRGIAADAGVALQTVRNHFASKDELFTAAVQRIAEGIDEARWVVTPGDTEGAISVLVDDYERNGDANLRLLAVEDRVPIVQPVMAMGREGHQAWVEHVFADVLAGLRGKARARRRAQLVLATDVYAWKLLRRDRGLDVEETKKTMRELVAALEPS
jgi:AcrR family transcriptional regulator